MSYFKLSAILLLSFWLGAAYAQQPEAIISNLQKTAEQYPQEKVYVHLDKPHYVSGDDMWFKAYITLGEHNQLSSMSRVLHAELVSPTNKIISNLHLLILHGVSIGDIHLPDSLEEGTYHLRAYTNWMLNFSQKNIFDQSFTIGHITPEPLIANTTFRYDDAAKKLNADIELKDANGQPIANRLLNYALVFDNQATGAGVATTDAKGSLTISFNNGKNYPLHTGVLNLKVTMAYNKAVNKNIKVVLQPQNKIQFMPEGGSLVTGLQSRVAFKILRPDGLGATGNGYIADDAGNKVTEFTTSHLGMGSFYFTPEAGKNYKAVISYADQQEQTVKLPAPLAEGYTLTLNTTSPGFVNMQISASPNLVKNQKVNLLVQKQGTVLFFSAVTISKTLSGLRLPLAGYPAGVIQVTLFNEEMQPQAERLFFNMNTNALLPLTASTAEHTGVHKPVVVTVQAGTANDSIRVGSFSASVINLSRVLQLPDNSNGITAGLLLTPDLKGYIEQPNYYFDDVSPTKKYELDNLILCQGWHHIAWDSVKAGKVPAMPFLAETGFSVSGVITKGSSQSVPNAKVNLLKASSFAHIDTVADANGRFVFEHLLINDSTKFALQATDAAGNKKVRIKLDEQPAVPAIINTDIPFNNNEFSYQAFLKSNYPLLPDSVKQNLMSVTALRTVTITGQKPSKIKYSANINGPGVADQAFAFDEFKNFGSVRNFLDGRALGIKFDPNGYPFLRGNARPMQVFIDGVPMLRTDTDEKDPPINSVSIQDIESIEILRNADKTAIYGAAEGVIIITTKTADTKRIVPFDSNYVPVIIAGYNTIRTFYTPDYEVKPSTKPDHRATVYWKPDIITDKNGNASFKFFTTDDTGTYQLRIEGMTPDGKLAHLLKTITVE